MYVLHRFSGVTEEDLENVTISLRDVQAVLLSMFSAESILIGHSLESDLLALKVIWLFIIWAGIQWCSSILRQLYTVRNQSILNYVLLEKEKQTAEMMHSFKTQTAAHSNNHNCYQLFLIEISKL